MQTSKINRLGNGVVCVLLVVCLLFSSFFNVRKAEAIAPAIPAGLGLAALAAELGISTEALCIGLGSIFVAGTGLYIAQNDGNLLWGPTSPTDVGQELNWRQEWQDGSLDLPGWDTWGDLDQETQEAYGTPRNYLQWQWNWLALQTGLLDYNNNGGLEPSEEPDPEQDPNGNQRWNKARNALIALAVGGASVPLSGAVGALADSMADGFKQLLFGTESQNDSMKLSYKSIYMIDDRTAQFMTFPDWEYTNQNNYTYSLAGDKWASVEISGNTATFLKYTTNGNFNVVKDSYQSTLYWRLKNNTTNPTITINILNGGFSSQGNASTSKSVAILENNYLNAAFSGTYVFANGTTYTNGNFTGDYSLNDIDYGQLSDTPEGLGASIINNNNYNNFINNYSDSGVEGYQRAVTVPQGYGQSGYQPNYSDFVVVTPDEDVTPLPGDSQLPAPGPDNPTNPDTPETEYEQDFGQRVGELLAQPFDQLFPFCLIGDLRDFLEILEDAGFGANEHNGMRALSDEQVNGIDVLRFDLSGFNVDGAEYFEIELTPIHDFAVGFRGISTSVFIIMLLIGTFRFFINRGGE